MKYCNLSGELPIVWNTICGDPVPIDNQGVFPPLHTCRQFGGRSRILNTERFGYVGKVQRTHWEMLSFLSKMYRHPILTHTEQACKIHGPLNMLHHEIVNIHKWQEQVFNRKQLSKISVKCSCGSQMSSLVPRRLKKSERSAWYPLFAHARKDPLHFLYNLSRYVRGS